MGRASWKRVIQQVDRLCAEGTSSGWADDQLLARLAMARDESALAFEAIVRRHGPMVLEACLRVLRGDRYAAEDAFQATFLVLLRRAGSIAVSPNGSLGPWLHRVAFRMARRAYVASSRRDARERRAAERKPVATMEDRPSAFDSDDYRILHEEVARLPAKYRAAVVLCYFEGLTHDQAAASLRWPVGTVRGYLARARAMLRTRLIRRGLAPAVAAGVLAHPSPSSATALAPGLVDAVTSAVSDGAITPTVADLARPMARGLFVASIRRSVLCALVVALGLSGLGLTAAYLKTSAPPPGPPRPGGSTPVGVPAEPFPEGVAARIGTTRFNHGSLVSYVAFSPDGSVLASFGWDHVIRLWDPSTGREIRQIGQPADDLDRAVCPVFSPDGRTLAVGTRGKEGRISLFEVASGRERRRSDPFKGILRRIAFAPDGQTLATADDNSANIVLWNADSLKELRRLRAHRPGTWVLAFSSDGRSLAIGADDRPSRLAGQGSAAVFDLATGRESKRFTVRGTRPVTMAFSRDGRLMAMGTRDGSISVLDLATGGAVRRLTADQGVMCLRFSPDGAILAAGASEPPQGGAPRNERISPGPEPAIVTLWDVATGREQRRIPAHIQGIYDLDFTPDGRTLASCGAENVVRLWDVASGRERLGSDAHRSYVRSLAITPDGGRVVTGGYDSTIREWGLATGRPRRVVARCDGPLAAMDISPDGKVLVTGSYDQTCRSWDMASGQELRRFEGVRGRINHVAISPDGRSLYAGMKVFDLATGRLKASLLDPQGKEYPPWGSAAGFFTADSAGVLAHTEGIQLFDAASGRRLGLVANPPQRMFEFAVSYDGRLLATGGDRHPGSFGPKIDYSIRIWEVASGQEVARLGGDRDGHVGGPSGPTHALVFSHDGRWLASAGVHRDAPNRDATLRLWDLTSLVPRRHLQGHRSPINQVAFSRDDRWLVSASEDATALVWDMAKLELKRGTISAAALELGSSWADLGGDDAARAYRAIWRMAADPDRALPFLADRLKPIAPNDKATNASTGLIPDGETLRRLRAIAVLEKLGTPEARRLLERVASGFVGARESRDAEASLVRLKVGHRERVGGGGFRPRS